MPVDTKVVTTPAGVMARTLPCQHSVVYSVPPGLIARAPEFLSPKEAAAPVPSTVAPTPAPLGSVGLHARPATKTGVEPGSA